MISSLGRDKDSAFEGTISATLSRAGTETSQYVFMRKGHLLRIENTTNKLEPVNIVDLGAKRLTIVYPHNTTFVRVDLTRKQAQPNMPGLPPGIQLPSGISPGSGVAGGMAPAPTPAHIGPNLSGLPSPPPGLLSPPPLPPMPAMPAMPQTSPSPAVAPSMPQLPPNVGPPGVRPQLIGSSNAPAGAPNIPPVPSLSGGMMPPMPPMPGMFGATELKKTDKTRKIQGFDCTLYTVTGRGETFEIWATNDSTLFPFQLITRDYIGRRFGPQMLEETWPALLQNKGLFPLEATMKMDPGGQERFSFKIDKVEKSDGSKIDDKVFQPPENYIKINAPQG